MNKIAFLKQVLMFNHALILYTHSFDDVSCCHSSNEDNNHTLNG